MSERALVRVGTRRSALAKTQTNWIITQLTDRYPELKVEIVEVVTTGDKILDTALSKVPGKGVFVKEIEEKLLAGEIDIAVHSMKDLPTEFPDGLEISVVPDRVDPRDALVTRLGMDLQDLPEGARIGTSSLRRQAQLLNFRPDFEIVDIRGNIDTRLRKSETDEYDGIILASAGLIRMGWDDRIRESISCNLMTPAVGQGALGIETRTRDSKTHELLSFLNNDVSARAVNAERRFLAGMGGGCQTPMGAYCRVREQEVIFKAFSADDDGSNLRRAEISGDLSEVNAMADELVAQLSHKQ